MSFIIFLGINHLFSQSKKERFEILNTHIDSLNNELDLQKQMSSKVQLENHELSLKLTDTDKKVAMLNSLLANLELKLVRFDSLNNELDIQKRMSSKVQSENYELSIKLTDADKKVAMLNSLLANLELQLKTLPLNIDTDNVIDEKKIVALLKRINKLELQIPVSNYYNKKKIKNYTVYELDFSKEPIDSLSEKYNVESPDRLEVRIAINDKNLLLFVKYSVSCCPGDNTEGIIFPVGDKLLSIEHSYGMYGGSVSVKLDDLETGTLKYSINEEEKSNDFLDFFNK